MANKTYAVHTEENNIKRIDEHAKRLRRSRNSIINEAIEVILDIMDLDRDLSDKNAKKKAGK